MSRRQGGFGRTTRHSYDAQVAPPTMREVFDVQRAFLALHKKINAATSRLSRERTTICAARLVITGLGTLRYGASGWRRGSFGRST